MKKYPIILVILALLLAACNSNTPLPPTPTPSTVDPAATAVDSTATPQAIPATSTPSAAKVLLVAPDLAAAEVKNALNHITELAASSSLTVETLTDLTPANLTPDVHVVVLLAAPDNLNDLLAAAPKTQFVALGLAGLEAKANLSVITRQPEQEAYVAGFIATIISEDWRAAGLLPDTPASLQEAFVNGGRYYCGRCIPIHGPIVLFPLASALPAGSSLDAWKTAVTTLQTKILETVYVDPTISTPELLKSLVDQKLTLVGGSAPTPDAAPQWAATVSADLFSPLKALWPGLVSGVGNKSSAATIQLSDINPGLLTPGKQRLVQDVITGLAAGTIDPLAVQ